MVKYETKEIMINDEKRVAFNITEGSLKDMCFVYNETHIEEPEKEGDDAILHFNYTMFDDNSTKIYEANEVEARQAMGDILVEIIHAQIERDGNNQAEVVSDEE